MIDMRKHLIVDDQNINEALAQGETKPLTIARAHTQNLLFHIESVSQPGEIKPYRKVPTQQQIDIDEPSAPKVS